MCVGIDGIYPKDGRFGSRFNHASSLLCCLFLLYCTLVRDLGWPMISFGVSVWVLIVNG